MTGIERLRDIADDRYSGGMVHISVQKLREICEQIEREFGVETVKAEGIAANNRRIELCGALGIDTDTGWSDAMAEMVKRLMPEGCEWPRYESGEPVEVGDDVVGPDYGEHIHVDAVKFHANGFVLCDKDGFGKWYESDDRFERPAPKVLDADGVEIRVGDTVWHKESGMKFTVEFLPSERGYQSVHLTDYVGAGFIFDPNLLTHRAPVLAADGKPLREGETVWGTNGGSYHITSVHDGEVFARHVGGSFGAEVESAGGEGLYRLRAEQLTHERPVADTWERLEDDATMPAATYCERMGVVDDGGYSPEELMSRDLVRRCRALAERGQ